MNKCIGLATTRLSAEIIVISAFWNGGHGCSGGSGRLALGFPAVYEFLKAQRLSEAARVTLTPVQSQTYLRFLSVSVV